jgi:NAD(P) transhydrogenase
MGLSCLHNHAVGAPPVDYDLLVIGSGPAGQKAAVQGAKLGRRVGIVERRNMVGGVCVNTGTIPSKTLREAVIYLTGLSQHEIYGSSYRVKADITMSDLVERTRGVIAREIDVIRDQLQRNHIDLIPGEARFVDSNTLSVDNDGTHLRLSADVIVIAVGTTPTRPQNVEFDERVVIDSDGLLLLERIPSSIVVVGAGVIGIEYASMLASLGTKVTVVERRPTMLDFCDDEIIEALRHHLRDRGLVFRFGEAVTAVERHDRGVVVQFESGKQIATEAVFYSAGRDGATGTLGLDAVGLEPDERGRLRVDAHFRTAVPHIFAVGDVIGFPSLAATSMEQGRRAARAAFGEAADTSSPLLPIGIYTIPEISFVGNTERELTDVGTPYEIGLSRYRELARGQILGDSYGMLKLLVSTEDRRLLGAHVIGTGATEVVHIGQTLMAFGGTVDYLVDAVFNYPTLAESYKVAALDASNKIDALERLTA